MALLASLDGGCKMLLRSLTYPARLFFDDDLNIPLGAQHVDSDIVLMAHQEQINFGVGHFEVVDAEFMTSDRKARASKTDLGPRGIDFETKTSLKQEEDRGGGPCLRGTRNGIRDRPLA